MSYFTNYGKAHLVFIYKDRGTSFIVFNFIMIYYYIFNMKKQILSILKILLKDKIAKINMIANGCFS